MTHDNTDNFETLRARKALLALDGSCFRNICHRLVDQIGNFLDALPHGPVMPAESPETVRLYSTLVWEFPRLAPMPVS